MKATNKDEQTLKINGRYIDSAADKLPANLGERHIYAPDREFRE